RGRQPGSVRLGAPDGCARRAWLPCRSVATPWSASSALHDMEWRGAGGELTYRLADRSMTRQQGAAFWHNAGNGERRLLGAILLCSRMAPVASQLASLPCVWYPCPYVLGKCRRLARVERRTCRRARCQTLCGVKEAAARGGCRRGIVRCVQMTGLRCA